MFSKQNILNSSQKSLDIFQFNFLDQSCCFFCHLFLVELQQYLEMSIIQRFFTANPFLIRKILKPANVINQVSPNLYENLRDSSRQFIKGVANKDVQYIKQVSGNAIGSRLAQELEENKDADFTQLYKLDKIHIDTAEYFEIAPYVIFGQSFKERVNNPKLFEGIRPISSNRFIKNNPNLNFIERLKTYGQIQIFGFNCLYQPLLVNVSSEERAILSRPFMATFETDHKNIDFFVVDCQGALFEDWKVSGFPQ